MSQRTIHIMIFIILFMVGFAWVFDTVFFIIPWNVFNCRFFDTMDHYTPGGY